MQRGQELDNFFQILLLSLSFGTTVHGNGQDIVMMSSRLKSLALWNDYSIWKKIFKYYCESNAFSIEEENQDSKGPNEGFFASMIGFFMKPEVKQPTYKEEVVKKSFHDLEHLMLKLEFPFEQLSNVMMKIAKQ